MKKITAFLLIICMFFSFAVSAEEAASGNKTVYLFGDEWAEKWGEVLMEFFCEPSKMVNAAKSGELLSQMSQKAEYAMVKSGDVVIISYGVLEKDRAGDNNAVFKASLEKNTAELEKRGARVIFASICSTMRFNAMTNMSVETKNYYTETTRAFAKKNANTYIDLAYATAEALKKTGSANSEAVYKSAMELSDDANRMCAYEVFRQLCGIDGIRLENKVSRVYEFKAGEHTKVFDMFFEDSMTGGEYKVFVKGGRGVSINATALPDGDCSALVKSVDRKISFSSYGCEKIQITPIYKFDAAGFSTEAVPFEGEMLPGEYDVTVKKSEPLKASVYLNDYMVASNLDMPGTEAVPYASEHIFTGYDLPGGKFRVHVTGLTDKLEYIYFNESAKIYDKEPRIYVGGDSTVCNYYPLERTGEEPDGTVMTGWAMELGKYTKSEVVNLASSGDWAEKWLKTSFSVVEKEGEAGDFFIVQFGINDRYHSTIENMKASLGEMIDRCAAKGIIPILVSPQISAGYGWGDEGNAGKSDGGTFVEFFDAVRVLAKEKECFYVDLTDLSSGWFSEVGRNNVYKKYHIWDYEKNEPKDMMHLSYKGADAMCRFFVLGIKNMQAQSLRDGRGNSLDLLKFS